MNTTLEGKFAAVTGATRGIGRAIAASLARAGASVAICGRSRQGVERAVEELCASTGGKVIGQTADISRWEDAEAFFRFVDERFGALDILVNNAGIGRFQKIADLSVEDWRATVETNLYGPFYCSKLALGRFRKRGGGFIVNISSLAGKNAVPGGTAYNASKFGLNGMSEATMLDHRYDNVRVSYVMPGSVATEFGAGGGEDWKIAPEDVAAVVLLLLQMPERTLVSRVEIRPTKPKK